LGNDFTFKEELADIYQLIGEGEKATAISNQVIAEMSKNAAKAAVDESIGHYADKELAYAYLKVNNYDKALEHALAEYNRRPKNIEVNETLAWVYYKRGEHTKALPYIQEAMKTNSKNPVLLCRASLIYKAVGNNVKAKEHLQEALKNNPNIPELLKNNSVNTLKQI
jgi:tetratricopeptide (TPR) repeat protein